MARVVAKGQAVLLGGLVAATTLCACLSLIAFAFLLLVFIGFLYQDDHHPGGLGRAAPAVFLIATLAVSLVVARRVGWQVSRDWYRNAR